MLAYFVYFRVQHADQPTLLNYADFMWRVRLNPDNKVRVVRNLYMVVPL